jgi:GT2 family glycosyltransferase
MNSTTEHVDISVIILSWNTKILLLRCLDSIINSKSKPNIEVIVVDNGSTDGSVHAVREKYPEVIVIRNDANLGFAKGNNIGIIRSRGRYICLINSDVEVLDSCFDLLYDYMEQNRSVGIVGPKILWPDFTLQDSCREFPNLWNNFCAAIKLNKLFPKSNFFSGEHMMFFAHDRICRVDSLVGAFLLVRKEAIDQVGGFDERFFIYAEEIDLCRRFWMQGWEVVFYNRAEIVHYGRGSSSREPLRFTLEQQKSILQYWRKHHGRLSQIGIRSIALLYHVLRIMLGVISCIIKYPRTSELYNEILKHLACMRLILTGKCSLERK